MTREMLDVDEFRQKPTAHIEAFECEVKIVHSTLVLPRWGSELHGFPQTLYGYMMAFFARIDLLSAYWRGNAASRDQTIRMIDFMDQYISGDHEANSVAVQIWRHKLMHTSEPRFLLDERTGKVYRWLLHWWKHLPLSQHYIFADTSDSRVLSVGLVYLIADLKTGIEKYLADLSTSPMLQSNAGRMREEITTDKFRIYKPTPLD